MKHNPSMVDKVDELLEKMIEARYGETPEDDPVMDDNISLAGSAATNKSTGTFASKSKRESLKAIEDIQAQLEKEKNEIAILEMEALTPTEDENEKTPTEDDNKKTPTKYGVNKKRLSEFYMKHDPSKVDTVDEILEKYAGNEEILFRKLEKKYGEAPAVEPEMEEELDNESYSGSVASKSKREALKVMEEMQTQLDQAKKEIAILEMEALGGNTGAKSLSVGTTQPTGGAAPCKKAATTGKSRKDVSNISVPASE